MGDNKVVYEASRWLSAILAVFAALLALAALWLAWPWQELPSLLLELQVLPLGGRVVLALLAALFLLRRVSGTCG